MNLSMLASITKREKEESRLVLNINTIGVVFFPRQTLYDLTELLVCGFKESESTTINVLMKKTEKVTRLSVML